VITQEEYALRRKKLQRKVADQKLDAFLVSSAESIYYLTGTFYVQQERPFFIVVWPDAAPELVVPALEKVHMQKAGIGNVKDYWEYPSPKGLGWSDKLLSLLAKVSRLGVEPTLSLEIAERFEGFSTEPYPLVEHLRLVKSPAEIAMIRNAARYADLGMERVLTLSYYGATALEIFSQGRAVQIQVLKDGEFEPSTSMFLTAAWPAPLSSQPHEIPKINDKLKDGPLVAMSFLRVNGYAAEVERTYFHRSPTLKVKEAFEAMQEARERAFAIVKPGVKCADVDVAANGYLKERGYGDCLLHRTGHGIGLGNHEGPWVAEGNEEILQENMVISIEPGIYMPDVGGVRHSDTVLVTKHGAESLTKYPTDLKSLMILRKKPLVA
jgi:Xaa-Pro dipeptidase